MDSLVVTRGRDRGRSFDLPPDREIVIGRLPECGIILADPRISRRHCAIYRGMLGYVVKDLGGVNGTFLNGARIKEAQLEVGDRLRVGATELELRGAAAAPAGAATPVTPAAAAGPAGARPAVEKAPAASTPPAAPGLPGDGGPAHTFCAHCLKDLSPGELAAALARSSVKELLCASCAAERAARAEAARVAEDIIGAQPAPPPVPRIPTPAQLRAPEEGQQPTPVRGAPAAPPAPRTGPGTTARRAVARRSTVRYFPVTRGQQIRSWISLALAVAIVVVCLVQLPDAWLNFRGLLDSGRFAVQRVDVELVDRGVLGVSLAYAVKPAEGAEVKAVRSGGPIMKFQYDELARMAKTANARPQFEVVYDTRDPQRNCLRDRMGGLPPLIVGLLAILWGGWDIRKLVRFFRQEREETDRA